MVKRNLHNKLALSWGEKNGFDVVKYVSTEGGKEYYYLFDSSLRGLKTGRPQFISIGRSGEIERSCDWDAGKVMDLYRQYLSL